MVLRRGPAVVAWFAARVAAADLTDPTGPSLRSSCRADLRAKLDADLLCRSFLVALSSPRGAPASGSPSESAAERAGAPQRAGAQRRSPRGSPVATAHRSPWPRPGRSLRSRERPGARGGEAGPKGNPERGSRAGHAQAPPHAIYGQPTPMRLQRSRHARGRHPEPSAAPSSAHDPGAPNRAQALRFQTSTSEPSPRCHYRPYT
jgi:hypothetical protein